MDVWTQSGTGNTNGSGTGRWTKFKSMTVCSLRAKYKCYFAQQHPQGDYNRNGTVDAADYVVWRKQVGHIVPACSGADANCNTFVEAAEYQPWRENFGRTGGTGAKSASGEYGGTSNNVPEPTSLVLIVAAGMVVTRQRFASAVAVELSALTKD